MSEQRDTPSKGESGAGNSPGPKALVWLVLLVVAAWIYPMTPLSGWIFCPFRALTDLSCAGCGMTRSVTAFVRGDWAASWSFHPAGPLLFLSLLIAGGLRLADRVTGRTLAADLRARGRALVTPVCVGLIVVLFIFWGWRLYGELLL